MRQLTALDDWLLAELRGSPPGLTVGELHSRASSLVHPPTRVEIAMALDKLRIWNLTTAGPFPAEACVRTWSAT